MSHSTLAASDFELLFGALPTPGLVLDPAGTVLAVNAAAAALFPAAAPGQPGGALWAQAGPGVVLPEAAAWEGALSQARAGAVPVLSPRPADELPAEAARRYWQLTLQPVPGAARTEAPAALRFVLLHLLDVSEQVQARAASRRQQHLLQLTHDLPQLLWTTNAEGLVNYANQAWYDYTGLSPIATYGRGWLSAVHPHDRDQVAARWQEASARGEKWECTFRLSEAATGLYRWHLTQAVAQRDAQGQPQRWLASTTNIHAQQAEAQRQARRQRQDRRLLTQLDQLPLYLVMMRGPAHEISYVSASARPHLPEAAVGQPAAALQPGPSPATLAAFDEVYRTGESRHLGQLPLLIPNDAPRYVDVTALPLRAPDGSVEGVLMTGIDVTDRLSFEKQVADVTAETQRQLMAKEARQRRILDQLPSYIATYEGPELRLSYLSPNHVDLLGSAHARVGQPLRQAAPELADQGLEQLLRTVFETGVPHQAFGQELEFAVPASGGRRTRYLNFGYYPLYGEAGRPVGVLTFAHDVTAQVLARRQAEELQARVQRRDRRIRLMTESLPLISYSSTADGQRTEYLSPQWYAYTGTDPAAADVSTEWARALHPDDLAAVGDAFGAALRERRAWAGELRLRRHDGQYRWHLTRALPELDADTGAVLRWYGSTTDIHELREAQHQLEAKDLHLNQILSQSPALMATMQGPEHRFVFTNPGYNALVGGRVRLGQPVDECLPEMREQGFIDLLDGVYRSGQPFRGEEVPVAIANPSEGVGTRYLDFTYQPLHDGQGQIVGILAFVLDVSERVAARRQAEALAADLREGDERLQALSRTVPVFLFSFSATGQLTYFNPYFFEYTGLAPESPLEQAWSFIHPDDVAGATAMLEQGLAQRSSWEASYRMRRADGEYRWCQTKVQPSLDASGEVTGYSGATIETHEQHELTSQLARREEEFRFLAESVPQIMWTARADGWLDYYNQRWVDYTGLSMEQSMGPGREPVLHPDDMQAYSDSWTASLRTGGRYQVEYRFRRHDGQYRWHLGRAEAMRDAAGNIVKWFGTCTDIDDFKRAQQHLEQKNAALLRTNEDLDNFVYTASHDLKQPINNMAGIFEELTRTAYFRDPDAIKLIAYFERALKQIYGTIEDLSAIVQVQRQQGEVAPEDVPLAGLTAEIINSVHDQVSQSQATFELDFDTCPSVRFIRANLQSVLFNLISNSLKYAAPDRPPHIRLSCAPHAATGRPVLTVQDNGLGIDLQRYRPQLFQLFRRFHHHVEGSGMGLYLVNRIVQNHGGQLEVDSTVGEGTTFRLYL